MHVCTYIEKERERDAEEGVVEQRVHSQIRRVFFDLKKRRSDLRRSNARVFVHTLRFKYCVDTRYPAPKEHTVCMQSTTRNNCYQ